MIAEITSVLSQFCPKLSQFNDFITTRLVSFPRLLIRHGLTIMQEFKSLTLRKGTFTDEKSATTSNKNPGGIVHLGFFVLVGDHSANFPTFFTFCPNFGLFLSQFGTVQTRYLDSMGNFLSQFGIVWRVSINQTTKTKGDSDEK